MHNPPFMDPIIPPVSRELLKQELTRDRFIRMTNNGNNEIYIVDHHNAPHVMQEVGRLRELTFREAGGGTGKPADIDDHDTSPVPFQQLIVWQPQDEEIVGGYRYILCQDLIQPGSGDFDSPTSGLFSFSRKFIDEFLPYTIELGRSFVQPAYQPSLNSRKGIYSLDNLWDGLGALMVDHPHIRYFFGKITMYPHTPVLGRELILFFLQKHFPDPDELVRPHKPVPFLTPLSRLNEMLSEKEYAADYRLLVQHVRSQQMNIPPLVNAYMNLSPTMRSFGTAINDHFGKVEETGIMVTIGDIYDGKVTRHVSTYQR